MRCKVHPYTLPALQEKGKDNEMKKERKKEKIRKRSREYLYCVSWLIGHEMR
jgi:hypothetical protein